jgi:allantoin racemase
VTAPFKFAELLADLAGFGWTHSKAGGYESPPVSEIAEWGIEDEYENADVWTRGGNE